MFLVFDSILVGFITQPFFIFVCLLAVFWTAGMVYKLTFGVGK